MPTGSLPPPSMPSWIASTRVARPWTPVRSSGWLPPRRTSSAPHSTTTSNPPRSRCAPTSRSGSTPSWPPAPSAPPSAGPAPPASACSRTGPPRSGPRPSSRARSSQSCADVPSAAMSVREMVAAVAALLVAAYLVRRWRRLSFERRALAIVLLLGLAIYASGVLSALPDPKQLIEDLAKALGPWTYALVGVAAFLETGAFVGLVAPGETIVISGGVIAGQGEIDLLPLIGIVWACAVLGDTTSFYIGRRLGRRFLEKHGPRVKITHERLDQVDGYFDRHGGKTILIGRFIGLVRALAPFIAGASGLPYRRFIPYSIVGCGAWATIFCVLGYIFWRSFDKVQHLVGQALFGFAVTVGVIVGVVTAYRRREEIRSWLEAHRGHPLVKPLFVIGAPLYRWIVRPVVRVLRP